MKTFFLKKIEGEGKAKDDTNSGCTFEREFKIQLKTSFEKRELFFEMIYSGKKMLPFLAKKKKNAVRRLKLKKKLSWCDTAIPNHIIDNFKTKSFSCAKYFLASKNDIFKV